MPKDDTSPEAQRVLTQIYRRMTMEKRLRLVFDAYETGRALAMTGLRRRYPQASSKELWRLWARQHLGEELFSKVYGATSHG
jgi:hypothetical protein